ncbi:MAG: hypothetical protein MZW92_23495 [Comamonadaceae bacterium]|nr:hypothetical protein [Comamonadaceae bacterium]
MLMDCHMPAHRRLRGHAGASAQRERLRGARPVPIIALTANALEGARERRSRRA